MDILGDDPAKWLIFGLVASVHVTWRQMRKQSGRIEPRYLPSIAIFGVVAAFFWLPFPLIPPALADYSPHSVYWLLLPIGCGIVYCLRNHSTAGRAAVMVAAVGLSSTMIQHRIDMQTNSQKYMANVAFVYPGSKPALQLGDFVHEPKSGQENRVAAGYLTPPADHDRTPYYLIRPEALWHSPVTGLYGRVSRPVAVWTPGGPPLAAFRNARLIPLDVPEASVKGRETTVGLPVGRFPWHSQGY